MSSVTIGVANDALPVRSKFGGVAGMNTTVELRSRRYESRTRKGVRSETMWVEEEAANILPLRQH